MHVFSNFHINTHLLHKSTSNAKFTHFTTQFNADRLWVNMLRKPASMSLFVSRLTMQYLCFTIICRTRKHSSRMCIIPLHSTCFIENPFHRTSPFMEPAFTEPPFMATYFHRTPFSWNSPSWPYYLHGTPLHGTPSPCGQTNTSENITEKIYFVYGR